MASFLLSNLCYVDRYKQVEASLIDELSCDGDVKLLPSSKVYDLFTNEEKAGSNLCQGEVITLGRARYANLKYWNGKFISSNNHIFESKNSEILLTKYLYYYFAYSNRMFYVEATTYPKFDMGIFKKTFIDVPDIQLQNDAVFVLDNILETIDSYKRQIRLLIELIKSRFLEMFGDPDSNSFNWRIVPFSTIGCVLGGYAFQSQNFKDSGIPVLRIGNINSGFFKPDNLVFWPYDKNLSKYEIKPGDLTISLTGTVGKDDYANVCVLGNDYDLYYLNQRNAKLILGNKINKTYLKELLSLESTKLKLTGISRGQRQANLSNKDILNMLIPLPPIELQKSFEEFVNNIEKIKNDAENQIKLLTELYNKNMVEYFGGNY